MTQEKERSNSNNGIPQWQSNRMRNLINERLQEVWEIVEARKKAHINSQK